MALSSALHAPLAHFGEHDIDALLVEQAQARAREAHLDVAVFALDPDPAVLQVGEIPTLGLVVRVGHMVSAARALARDLANACHGNLLKSEEIKALDVSTKGARHSRTTAAEMRLSPPIPTSSPSPQSSCTPRAPR